MWIPPATQKQNRDNILWIKDTVCAQRRAQRMLPSLTVPLRFLKAGSTLAEIM